MLEAIGKVKHIAFDKTGTLTADKPVVTDVVALEKMPDSELLRTAAAAESGSSHPLASSNLRDAGSSLLQEPYCADDTGLRA